MMESWLINQLVLQGVKHFCIAPGSRSTPLVVNALAEKAKLHVHFDERGLGFFGLGIAKATSEPVGVIVTSGTAVGNLLPSVMEAHHSNIPLILLTADRPHELRDCGANQTTDQIKIFSPFARFQIDLPSRSHETHIRSVAAQSYFYSLQNPPGPVHINCSFPEPFCLTPFLSKGKKIELYFPKLMAPPFSTSKSKGLILIGKLPKKEDLFPIFKLASRLKWPILADILSNARLFPHENLIAQSSSLTPEIILHFGERFTTNWDIKNCPEVVHISPYPHLQDPERRLTAKIQSEIESFCETFEAPIDPYWLPLFTKQTPLYDEKIPEDFGIFLGNSTIIRDADKFLFPKKCRGFFANRGLSGIDGNIATLAGLAETMPIFALIGDQTALHDLNSLPLLKKTKYPALLFIHNNFGGAIFERLPVVNHPYFETYWKAAHETRFEMAAKLFDLPYFGSLEEGFSSLKSGILEWTQSYFCTAF